MTFERLARCGRGCLVPALALIGGACAEPSASGVPSVGATTDRIIGGEKDTTHDAVVRILRSNPDGGGNLCSGTVFRVDATKKLAWVLTAAHCVEPDTANGPLPSPGQLVVQTGDDVDSVAAAKQYKVTAFARHPDRVAGSRVFDLAVLTVSVGASNLPVLPLLSKSEDDLRDGDPVTAIGYGVVAQTQSKADYSPFRKRVSLVVDGAYPLLFSMSQPTAGACFGDSGGPLLIGTQAGPAIAGTVAFGTDEDCLTTGWATRISPYVEWIDGVVAGSGVSDRFTCDECASQARGTGGVCDEATSSCGQDDACAAFFSCASACRSEACVDACGTPPSLWGPLRSCVAQACASSCTVECGIPKEDDACAVCYRTSCCEEQTACAADLVCAGCLDDRIGRFGQGPEPGPACSVNDAFRALDSCGDEHCAAACSHTLGTFSTEAVAAPPKTSRPDKSKYASEDDSSCNLTMQRGDARGGLCGVGAFALLLSRWRRRVRATS